MAAERQQIPFEEKFPNFNISDFEIGNRVAVYQNGAWRAVELEEKPKKASEQQDQGRDRGRLIIKAVGEPDEITTAVPIKKIELPPATPGGAPNTVEIKNETYTYDPAIFRIDQDGDAVYDLTEIVGGRVGRERLGVKAEILRNLTEARGMRQNVEDLLVRIDAVASTRRKELLARHVELVKKVDKLLLEFGTPTDWEDWSGKEVEVVGRKLEETRQQILDETMELEREMKRIEDGQVKIDRTNTKVEIGKINADRLEHAEKDEAKIQEGATKQKIEKEIEAWKKNKKNWEEYEKGGGGGKKGKTSKADKDAAWDASHHGEAIPTKPEEEPKQKEIDKEAAVLKAGWELFNSLADTHPLRQEVEKRRKELAVNSGMASGDFPFVDPARTKEEKKQVREFHAITVSVMKEVIAEWKGNTSEKFNFDKEKKELEDKLLELTKRIANYPPEKSLEARVKSIHNFLLAATKEHTTRDELLAQWREMGEIELVVYQTEISAKSKPELAERDIDIPQNLLMEIFAGRKDEVQNLMESLYKNSLAEDDMDPGESIKSKLKDLFMVAPDRTMLLRLKEHGIKSWNNFQTLLNGELGNKLVGVLNVMAQEHMKKEVAKNTSWWDKTKAIKTQMALRVASSVVLVGGGVVGATALFASGPVGWAGVGLAAAGGATGGLLRGFLNKFAFGHKSIKEGTTKRLKELEKRKQEEFVVQMGTNNFGVDPTTGVDRFADQTNAEFSAIMAQCLREASTAVKAGTGPEAVGVKGLDANSMRMYTEAIKDLEMSGTEVKEKNKKDFALALLQMQAKTPEVVQNAEEEIEPGSLKKFFSELAGPGSDPVLIKLLTGTMKAYSGNMESTGMALTFSTIAGAGMGVAFAAGNEYARAAMGGVGGALMGYQVGEGVRLRRGEKKGKEELRFTVTRATRIQNQLRSTPPPAPDVIERLRGELAIEVAKLKAALKGGRQFEVEKDGIKSQKEEVEQWYVLALQGDPMLRRQVENLVYEAEKPSALLEREQREDLGAVLEGLKDRRDEVLKECETKTGTRVWKFLGKSLERAAWVAGGAAVGAVSAVVVGDGMKEWKHILFGHSKDAGIGIAAAAVVAEEQHPAGAGAGHEPLPPSGGKSGDVLPHGTSKSSTSPLEHSPTPKSQVIEHPASSSKISHAEVIPEITPEMHTGGGLDFHNEHNPDVIRFTNEHHLTAKEFDYLQRLTDKYPQLNNPESLDKILHSAEFADGKACAHPEIYKGTINTPIESAADAKLSTLDGILKGGKGTADAVDFLKQQNFNAHSLKNLGITGLPKVGSPGYESALNDKLTHLVEQYQAGDKSAGKGLFDGFRHDMNRAQAPFMTEVKPGVEVLPVKGLKGMNPRVWGTDESGEVLVGQAKGYTPRVSPTMAEKLEHDVYHTEKVNPTHEIKNLTPEQEAANNKMFHDVMRNPNKVISNLPQEVESRLGPNARITEVVPAPSRGPNAALIKTDNGEWHAVSIHEAEVPVGMAGKSGAMETVYEISALEPVSDAVASQLGAEHGAGAAAVGLEAIPVHPKAGLDFSHPKFDPNSSEVKAVMASASRSGGGGGGAPKLETTGGGAPKLDTPTHSASSPRGDSVEPVQASKAEAPVEPKPAVKVSETTAKPEVAEHIPVAVEAKYTQAIVEVKDHWTIQLNNMGFGGTASGKELQAWIQDYLTRAGASHVGLVQIEVGGNFNTMVDNIETRLRAGLPPEIDFVLNHHPSPDHPILFSPDGNESNFVKFVDDHGKEFFVNDPKNQFKLDNDGRLLMLNEKGQFVDAECTFDSDGNPEVMFKSDVVGLAANE